MQPGAQAPANMMILKSHGSIPQKTNFEHTSNEKKCARDNKPIQIYEAGVNHP